MTAPASQTPDVESTVLDIIAQKANAPRATLSRATQLSSLTFASIDMLETIFEIEEIFDISVLYNANDAAAGNMKTAGDVIDLIQTYVRQKNAPAPH
jgi:acyl carrier protein